MEARFGLIFFVCVSFTVPGYDIAEKCTKQYDLTFRLTGYNCVIYGAGMFYYKDKQELDRITFNYLPAGAGILIDTESHVKTISIDEGDLRLCSNVHAPSGVTVRVNNQECVTNVNNIPSSSVPTSSTKKELDITRSSMETTTVDKKTSQFPSIKGVADIDFHEVWIYSSVVAGFVIVSLLIICIRCWCKRRRARLLDGETGSHESVTHFEMRSYHSPPEHEHVL